MQNRNTKLVQPSSSLHLNTFAEYKKRERIIENKQKKTFTTIFLSSLRLNTFTKYKKMANTNQEMQNTMYEKQNIYNNHLHAF